LDTRDSAIAWRTKPTSASSDKDESIAGSDLY
jgi:hypothetical protein